MSNAKIVSMIDHAEQRVKEDMYVALHTVTHSVRADLQAKTDAIGVKIDKLRADVDQLQERVDAIGVKIDKLRADVDQLQEGDSPSSNG